jgi:low affinity Fe/Cu permease
VSWFNHFADRAANVVAHVGFFIFCVALVIVWGPSVLVIRNVDTWQLIINTATTIITFLLVALLHNTQHRFEDNTTRRLKEILERLGLDDEDTC